MNNGFCLNCIGYDTTTKKVGNYGGVNSTNGEINPSINRLKPQLSFPSRLPSSMGMLSQISEIESDDIATSPSEAKLGNGNGDARFFSPGFPFGTWNDSPHFAENFSGIKREVSIFLLGLISSLYILLKL